MAEIFTSHGVKILVSDEDLPRVAAHKWSLNGRGYACRLYQKKGIYLHRFIVDAAPFEIIDHINRNVLDNRRENLRSVLKSVNCRNRGDTMRAKFCEERFPRSWYAYIKIKIGKKQKIISLAYHKNESEAQERIDYYHAFALSLQLERKSQEDVFRILSAMRAEERKGQKKLRG